MTSSATVTIASGRKSSGRKLDLAQLSDDALLNDRHKHELSGFSISAFKKWRRENKGQGPATIYVEGRPRTTVRDYREWIAGTRKACA